jgi:hypothetical protein
VHILDSLDLSKVNKIIIEVRNYLHMVKNSFGDLESYYNEQVSVNTSYQEGNYLIQVCETLTLPVLSRIKINLFRSFCSQMHKGDKSMYGWMGKILYVNLTDSKIKVY